MQQQAHSSKVWFITGAARGIGLSLARQALAQGNAVAATSRTLASLQQAFGDKHERLLPLEVDLVDEASVQAAIDRTVATFGRIDCVVNNAGYGQQGTIEALSDAELRRNFDVNVFAPLHVLRHALPHLRAQRSGHVFNVASIVGFQGGYAGWGSYVASKFALAGLTETLAAELAELNIKATVVYPGPVRTGFLSGHAGGGCAFDCRLHRSPGLAGPALERPGRQAGRRPGEGGHADPASRRRGRATGASVRGQDRQHPGRTEDAGGAQGPDAWRGASDATDFTE